MEYLSVDGLVKAVQSGIKANDDNIDHCRACLTGNYPGGVPDKDIEW